MDAVSLLGRYGLSLTAELSVDEIRARLSAQFDALEAERTPEEYERVVASSE